MRFVEAVALFGVFGLLFYALSLTFQTEELESSFKKRVDTVGKEVAHLDDIAQNISKSELYKRRFCALKHGIVWKRVAAENSIDRDVGETLMNMIDSTTSLEKDDFENTTAPAFAPLHCRERKGKKPLVLDVLFIEYSHQLDMLEVRMFELFDVVDWFVITESRFTQNGLRREDLFATNINRFARFMEKVVFVPLTDVEYQELEDKDNMPLKELALKYLRDKTSKTFHKLDNALVIVSELISQIPSRDVIHRAKMCDMTFEKTCVESLVYDETLDYVDGKVTAPLLMQIKAYRNASTHTMFATSSSMKCEAKGGASLKDFGGYWPMLTRMLSNRDDLSSKKLVSSVLAMVREVDNVHVDLNDRKKNKRSEGSFVPWALLQNRKRYAEFWGEFQICEK